MLFFVFLRGPHHRPVYDRRPENRRTSASTVSPAAAVKHRTHPLREEAARGRRGRRTAAVAAAVAIGSVQTAAAGEGSGRWESAAEEKKAVEARTRGVEGGLDAPVCASEEVGAGWEALCNGGSVARPGPEMEVAVAARRMCTAEVGMPLAAEGGRDMSEGRPSEAATMDSVQAAAGLRRDGQEGEAKVEAVNDGNLARSSSSAEEAASGGTTGWPSPAAAEVVAEIGVVPVVCTPPAAEAAATAVVVTE